jgi:hypothetical protein
MLLPYRAEFHGNAERITTTICSKNMIIIKKEEEEEEEKKKKENVITSSLSRHGFLADESSVR